MPKLRVGQIWLLEDDNWKIVIRIVAVGKDNQFTAEVVAIIARPEGSHDEPPAVGKIFRKKKLFSLTGSQQ